MFESFKFLCVTEPKAEHRVSLACACLAVGKYRAVVPIEEVVRICTHVAENILLAAIFVNDYVVLSRQVVAGSLVIDTHCLSILFSVAYFFRFDFVEQQRTDPDHDAHGLLVKGSVWLSSRRAR